jgi:EAL domain-containing protein (putative c-di-GMP-specific phosphodiesterase class I)
VIERLRFYQLPPDCLTVEISEAALGSEPELVRNCLQVLDRYGVKLAIDDFSGGASALAYLDDLPVSVVKIERTLIAGMMTDAARQTLVRSSIEFAHQRGLQVMAEGVENAATLQLLRDFRCDFAQGYYFGKPLPADAYPAWVQHQARRFQASSGHFTELAVGI